MVREAQTQNEQLFRALIEHSPDAITLLAPDGTIIYASPSTTRITGYSPAELVGTNSFALIHPDDQKKVREQLTVLITYTENLSPFEYRLRDKEGRWRWLEATATNLLNHSQVEAIVCRSRDITRRKHSLPLVQAAYLELEAEKEALRELELLQYTERKFRSFVESNIVGVMVTDQAGRMYEVNDRLVQQLGYSREELLNGKLTVRDLIVPKYAPVRARAWRTLISQGASLPEEKEYIRKNGSIFPALVAAATINQERSRALVMLLDISDRKDAERRKEELLSMVSHELRTPLTIIQGFLELALLYIESAETSTTIGMDDLLSKIVSMLQEAQRQTEIEARIVAELLDVSRAEKQRFEVVLLPCNLATIVQQVAANQRQMAPGRLLELILPSQTTVPVMADAGRIEQVLFNYLTNAFKYSPPDQVVRIQLTVEDMMARVSVYDQGPGLTLEQQQHVWDRFYQGGTPLQHGYDEGLGLGLHIARTIIAHHQGQVGVESCPGRGATFWFMLPLSDEQ
ncbi:MAG TPA: PAS domain-containing sensor histidine kinase [Ktedonobacteraceae bacterium]|nr:PAS domain-containing sensor histidine kinase [Ktedonobacteraceae bacterium]